MKRNLRIIVLLHKDCVPPESRREFKELGEAKAKEVRTEFDVVSNLRAMGHEVWPVGITTDLAVIKKAIDEHKPDIAFNLLEEFDSQSLFEPHVVGYLEMLGLPYTGSNSRGLMLAHDKALTNVICRAHRIRVPSFTVVRRGRKARRPRRLKFPLIVKSPTQEGSVGIAQASIVNDDAKLAERCAFVHEHCECDAMVEEYIDGRELYVGVMGNDRLLTLPIWEMQFAKLRDEAPRIATDRIKWNKAYQQKAGITTSEAKDLPEGAAKAIPKLCKRIYKALSISGYARLDLRLTATGEVYLIEANPNPQIAQGEDFADSAEKAGVKYRDLLQKILQLGLSYQFVREA